MLSATAAPPRMPRAELLSAEAGAAE